ncbi:hypothetical protein T4A_1881 [Trichinella pseudospiralis]|uniref:Uncharacterized protein n=1 Tax=Trichinella pseudospiralis TaxID=6337 RepID=A0A0V1EI21_TRIPS|nr:hypothetical protein T4A_1881 [Trichinella pseudospiralis]
MRREKSKAARSNHRRSRSPGSRQSRRQSQRTTSPSNSRGRNWNQSQKQASYNFQKQRLRGSERQKAIKKRSDELSEEDEPSPVMCSRCLQLIRPRFRAKNVQANKGIQRKSWHRAATRRPVRSRRKSPTVTVKKSSPKECLIEVPKVQKKSDTTLKLQFTAKRCPLRHGRAIVGRRLFHDSDDNDENEQKKT